MMKACDGLKDGEPEVDLGRAQSIDAPFAIMIPKLLVEVMEHLWSKELARTGQWKIMEKQFMDSIQMELLGFAKVGFNITRVGF